MAKRKRIVLKKNNRSKKILCITCIHEHLRFTNFVEGPNFTKLQELLLVVYLLPLTLNELGALLVVLFNDKYIYFENAQTRLTPSGINYFYMHKSSVIPPLTVAQPERKRV